MLEATPGSGIIPEPSRTSAQVERRNAAPRGKTALGGQTHLELIDLKHRRWVRDLAQSQAMIVGVAWLDDNHLLYVQSMYHVAVLDVRTGAQSEVHLPSELATTGPLHFAVSNDGHYVAFQNRRTTYLYSLSDASSGETKRR
jgi:hypothetical protein